MACPGAVFPSLARTGFCKSPFLGRPHHVSCPLQPPRHNRTSNQGLTSEVSNLAVTMSRLASHRVPHGPENSTHKTRFLNRLSYKLLKFSNPYKKNPFFNLFIEIHTTKPLFADSTMTAPKHILLQSRCLSN